MAPSAEPHCWAAQVVVGTLQHKVRLYNTRFRRPQLQLDFGEARITALAAEPSGGCAHTDRILLCVKLSTERLSGAAALFCCCAVESCLRNGVGNPCIVSVNA